MVFNTACFSRGCREIVGDINEGTRFVCAYLIKEDWCTVAKKNMAMFGVWEDCVMEFYAVKFGSRAWCV
jgi:hypothetical protein